MKWKEKFTEVFLINLPEMVDRWERSDEILTLAGIDYTYWEATKHEDGRLGLLASMKSLFEHVLESDLQNIMVLEDDFKFIEPLDVNAFLNILVDELPEDFHCLFLGCNLLDRPERISDHILRIGQSYSTHSICYSRKAVELILPLFDNPIAYDIMLRNGLQPLGKCYTCYPRLATQWAGWSSIEKREIDWEMYMRQTFAQHTKGI
jgi:hypothetical protein